MVSCCVTTGGVSIYHLADRVTFTVPCPPNRFSRQVTRLMPIKKSELYSSLWSSCDELRGGMDASQYKDYAFNSPAIDVN